ncbi:23S rRNA methyltransferase [Micromonospora sp. CPCC 205371]|nr:23S rRNA methyltransferase [Micromonospora sp. CPCC 205371]
MNGLGLLRCPLCRESMTASAGALRCARGHSFDRARQGYVNLATGRAPHSGDTAEMVAARAEFLAAGHYDFITTALCEAARKAYPGGLIVDAGAGTGHHLAAVLDALPTAHGLALDASKPALRRAARSHPRAGAALCDTSGGRPPPADGAAGLVPDVSAPRNGAVSRRVLRPGAALLVVTPETDHLAELVSRLGLLRVDPDKAERVAASLDGFALAGEATLRRTLTLSDAEARTLVAMGPSAWHTARVTVPDGITVTASVKLAVYVDRSISSQPAGGS